MTITRAELLHAGYRVVDGRAVREAATEPGDADTTWQDMQRKCYRVFVDAGCTVYWLSQARHSQQTPGLPDLIVFGPPGHPWHAAWETKAGRGKQSEAQRKFALHCDRTGFAYQSGSDYIARQFLKLMNSTTAPAGRAADDRNT